MVKEDLATVAPVAVRRHDEELVLRAELEVPLRRQRRRDLDVVGP